MGVKENILNHPGYPVRDRRRKHDCPRDATRASNCLFRESLRGGLGDLRAIIFEAASHFGLELRFEAGVLDGGIDVGDQVFGDAAAQFAAFEAELPLMHLFFPGVSLVLEA